jgi:hypothetical protein
MDIQLHAFLTSGLYWGDWSPSRPDNFIPGGITPGTNFIGGLMGPRPIFTVLIQVIARLCLDFYRLNNKPHCPKLNLLHKTKRRLKFLILRAAKIGWEDMPYNSWGCINVPTGYGLFLSVDTTDYTRWFKYDQDWFVCKQAAQVPVIFEPPCISGFPTVWEPQ